MILQALVDYFDRMVDKGGLERPGWQPAKVSFGLEVDQNGVIARVVPLQVPVKRGNKDALAPQEIYVPAQVKRAVNIAANFLCDNSSYILGIDGKGKPERARSCFEAAREMHVRLLGNSPLPEARAIVNFFNNWRIEDADKCEALKEYKDEIIAGGNLAFMFGTKYAKDIPEFKRIWDDEYNAAEGEIMQCLVTGERGVIATLHPNIKGFPGAQSSGASLVSFNAPAYESYGREGAQGANAPVGARAAFAYTAAINSLLGDGRHRQHLGDTMALFWAEDAQEVYCAVFMAMAGDIVTDKDMNIVMNKLAQGLDCDWDGIPLHPENKFFILGLSPNAARLSVRFFLRDSFGRFAANMRDHHERLEIARPKFDERRLLSFWQLLDETVNQKSRDKKPIPNLVGELERAVLLGENYPATLYNMVQMRIRAEREITRGRAAIIKAYLMKNTLSSREEANTKYEGALCVNLNENCNYPAYVLGRLFSVLEEVQSAANPNINTTIRDRYFNSACATPAIVFPQLIKLAQAHLKKLSEGGSIYYNKRITELLGSLNSEYPRRLSLYDQGIFQLGYYQQTQKRYEKKEDKQNV